MGVEQGRSKTSLDSKEYMGTEQFLDEVLIRVKEFMVRSQQEERIRNGLAHDSLRRTVDL